jgi:predicted acylesterase/phospholipase RssA
MVTLGSPTSEAETADQILGGTARVDAAVVVGLEQAMARAGERVRARALHAKRLAIDEEQASLILNGAAGEPSALLDLAKRLAGDKKIGLARRLLIRAREGLEPSHNAYRQIYQKSALYTYKDPDLPADWRLDRALELLEAAEDLAATRDPESLGLAGAICKRKWEVDSSRHHLDRALAFYLRGYALGAPAGHEDVLQYLAHDPNAFLDARKDQGYTGINAAFIMDVLARLEEESAASAGMVSESAGQRRRAARLIREEITRSVPSLLQDPDYGWLAEHWWFYATVGEAYFGLGAVDPASYDNAVEWLVALPARAGLERRAGSTSSGALDIPEWEFESTARQLARLATLQGAPGMSEEAFEKSQAGLALAAILRGDQEAVRSAFRGKFGLALSGGGFRASLFHIGVLASLAERDVLRHVEALSCVSGGSIIGAHYYLELRHLLETKADDRITASDYVAIVRRIEQAFLAGVQRNIRMRVLAELTTNLKMIFRAGYSRTLRVGELYERELFARVPDGHVQGPRFVPDWIAERMGHRRHRWLNLLHVHPMTRAGTRDTDFQPRDHNWRRRNKVPALILNATSLNTGHGWQFTVSFMGEPPTPINAEIDANERLRRMYYGDAPGAHRNVRLGHAVAASSCVPGLFEPLILDGLYPGRSVRLVDGGVCDNQGTASLLEQDCTVTLVSDASGQMEEQKSPSTGLLGVPLRANSILQARVREAQYSDVAMRKRSLLLRGMLFLHLKRDLSAEQVAWEDCPPDRRHSDFVAKRDAAPDATSYGLASHIQRKLAAVRTDLDSFNDIEAYALMTSGYRMTNAQFEGKVPGVAGFSRKVVSGEWQFRLVEKAVQPASEFEDPVPQERQQKYVARILDAGRSQGFKVWKLSPVLVALKWALAAAVLSGAAYFLYTRRQDSITDITFGTVGAWIASTLGAAVLAFVINRVLGQRNGRTVLKAVRWRDTLRTILIGAAMAFGGFIVARVHLQLFDRWFLRYGRINRLPR